MTIDNKAAHATESNPAISLPYSEQRDLQVQGELVNILLRQSRGAAIGTCLMATLSAYLLWAHVPQTALLVWAVSAFVLAAARLSLGWYYTRSGSNFGSPARWAWIFTFAAGLAGCFWGSLGGIFFVPDDTFAIVYVSLLLAGVMSGSVSAYASFLPAYFALAVPAVLPLAVNSLLYGGKLMTALGILLLFLLLVNLGYCLNIHKLIRKSVMMRFENLELLRQLTLEKERAETANRAKSQFLAAASHDLRQPTHALGLFVATLRALTQRPELKRADVENIAGRLQDALKNLGQLLNALLDVSRLDAGVVEAEKRPLALQDALTKLANEFSGPARAKGLDLTVVPSTLWVESDPIVLHRILSNLVSNAIRYTNHGRILVGCRRRSNQLELQVWDTGIGIAPEQISRIFQEFYQVKNVARDREQGLGLGLAIVQRLANLLGATLKVRSSVQGSMFSVMLPRAQMTVAASLAQQLPPAHEQAGKTVMVIDDDRGVLSAVDQLLSAWGHQVIAVSSIEQAVAAATEHSAAIGLILADYRLAENVNGADAIRAVIAQLDRDVPAVIITGDTSPERIREASSSGFKLLHKPLDPEALRLCLALEMAVDR